MYSNEQFLDIEPKNGLSFPQGLISRTKDFGDAYDSIQKKLSSIQDRFVATEGLQPDILAKKSQADQLKVSTLSRLTFRKTANSKVFSENLQVDKFFRLLFQHKTSRWKAWGTQEDVCQK